MNAKMLLVDMGLEGFKKHGRWGDQDGETNEHLLELRSRNPEC